MSALLGFIIGVFVGVILGFVAFALLTVNELS